MKQKSIIRTLTPIVIVIAAVAFTAATLMKNKKENTAKTALAAQTNSSVAVRATIVKAQPLQQQFTANGSFVPARQLNFPSEISGRVTSVLVDEGSQVKKGQTLAIIKADQLNVDVESAAAAYQNALNDKTRFENAFTTGGVTRQQLDQANLALSNAEARLTQAKLRVNDTYVKSSINGIVNKRFIEPGTVVAPGTQMFELVDISVLKLQVAVKENQVAQLKAGDQVSIGVSVFPDKTFSGKITFIAPKADNSLSFPMEITLTSNPGQIVRAGMYGTALFDLPSSAPVTLIPRSAFVGGVNSNEVFTINPDSTAVLRNVIAGRIMGDQVEILKGLKEGEAVITSGQINLSDGTKISLVE